MSGWSMTTFGLPIDAPRRSTASEPLRPVTRRLTASTFRLHRPGKGRGKARRKVWAQVAERWSLDGEHDSWPRSGPGSVAASRADPTHRDLWADGREVRRPSRGP